MLARRNISCCALQVIPRTCQNWKIEREMTIKEILDRLGSPDDREREEAEKALRDMGPAAVKPLVELCKEKTESIVWLFVFSACLIAPGVLKGLFSLSPTVARTMLAI